MPVLTDAQWDCVARMQSVQGGGRNTPVSSVI
jgi:hypothetical protein